MGASEKFCLRWNDFETNISMAFRELREEKDFFDVTLACDDSQVHAHKVILSACSPFFRQILRRNPHQHPLLYLKGVKYKELLSVLNFMYQGEVNVAQEELNSFLAVAEDLRVKGLTQNNTEASDTNTGSKESKLGSVRPREPPDRDSSGPPVKRPRPAPPVISPSPLQPANSRHAPSSAYKQDQEDEEDDIQEVVPVKSEPRDPIPPNTAVTPLDAGYHQDARADQSSGGGGGDTGQIALDETYQEDSYDYGDYGEGYDDSSGILDPNTGMPLVPGSDGNKEQVESRKQSIESWIQKQELRQGGGYACLICGFVSPGRKNLFCHVESKHYQSSAVPYNCPYCTKVMYSKNSYDTHLSRYHKEERNRQNAK